MQIVLGAAQFGSDYGVTNKKKLSLSDTKKILKYSIKHLKFIDTAIYYDQANHVLSKLNLKRFKLNSKIIIHQKHKNFDLMYKDVLDHLETLNISHLNYLLIHNTSAFNNFKNKKKIFQNLKKLKKKNLIKNFGISIYNKKEFLDFNRVGVPPVVQFPYNVFDTRFLDYKNIKLIKKNNILLQARSCFLQGLLNTDNLPLRFKKYQSYFNRWNEWCLLKKITKTEGCLSFVKKNRLIKEAVLGVSSLQELKYIVKILEKKKNIKIPFFYNINKKLIDPRKW